MDQLIKSAPSNQIELDVFKGEWRYQLPIPGTVSGQVKIIEDPTSVRLARECFGPLDGFKVLELGPLECEVTLALRKEKVKKIVAIECRSRHFLKCLVIKNILNLKNVKFLLGNFEEYCRTRSVKFDLCMACGVLYHMTDPVGLIESMCNSCDRVVVASHYVNDHLKNDEKYKNWIVDREGVDYEYKGLKVRYYKRIYGNPSDSASSISRGFGGVEDYASMMEKNDIIRTFEHFGFEIVGEIVDQPEGARGPGVVFAARKKGVPLTFMKNRYLKAPRKIRRQIKELFNSRSQKD